MISRVGAKKSMINRCGAGPGGLGDAHLDALHRIGSGDTRCRRVLRGRDRYCKTSESAGFNSLVRAVGASLGAQVCASIVASTGALGDNPSDTIFELGFAATAIAAALGLIAALAFPTPSVEHQGRAAMRVGSHGRHPPLSD
jgi:hypothetical protein